MVGHHDGIHPELRGPHRVLGRQHPLEQQRKPGHRPQLRHLRPGQRRRELLAGVHGHRRGAGGAPVRGRGAATVQMGGPHVLRQRELVAYVAQPPPHPGHVHGQHQRLAAGVLRTPRQLQGPARLAQPVQLEPDPAAERGDLLHRHGAQRAHRERHSRGLRRPRRRQFTVRMHQRLVSDRGHRHRHPRRTAQQVGAGRAPRHVPQHPRPDEDPVERLPVGGERPLASAAARDEVPYPGGQYRGGGTLDVRKGQERVRRRAAGRRVLTGHAGPSSPAPRPRTAP